MGKTSRIAYCLGWLAMVALIIWAADTGKMRWAFRWLETHPGSDKIGHFFLIGILGFLLNLALGCRAWRGWLIGTAIIWLASTAEEFSQLHFTRRSFDLLDIAANTAGLACFSWLARRLSPRPAEAAPEKLPNTR